MVLILRVQKYIFKWFIFVTKITVSMILTEKQKEELKKKPGASKKTKDKKEAKAKLEVVEKEEKPAKPKRKRRSESIEDE